MKDNQLQNDEFITLLSNVRNCCICTKHLKHGVNPILQIDPRASILIAGQAPGIKAHLSGIAFDDASGERLRAWMGIDKTIFYDPTKIAILPMGFCYPGKGKQGDLPPRPECEPAWRSQLLEQLTNIKTVLVVGQYAQKYHYHDKATTLTARVKSWQSYWPKTIPLPHPSPRNNIWLSKNPWFERDLVPQLQKRCQQLVTA